jgi:hypothetical protein
MKKEIPGVNAPISNGESRRPREHGLLKALLDAPGLGKPNETLVQIEQEEKAARQSRKATRKENKRKIKAEKKENKKKMALAFIELLIGASTGNVAATAKGTVDAAKSAKKPNNKDVVEGKFRVVNESKPKQLPSSKKS